MELPAIIEKPIRLAWRTAKYSVYAGVAFGALVYAPYTAITRSPRNIPDAMGKGADAAGVVQGVENWGFDITHRVSPHSIIMRTVEGTTNVLVVQPARFGSWLGGGTSGFVIQGGKELVVWAAHDLTASGPSRPTEVASGRSSEHSHGHGS